MKVVRLSALCTGRFFPPGDIPGTHFCYRPSQHQEAARIKSVKNPNVEKKNLNMDGKARK